MHKSQVAIAASLKVVNIVGILDLKHGSSAVEVNGRREKRCSIVPGMTCQEHFKAADYAFLNGFPSSTGQIFVCVFNSQGKRPGKAHGNPGGEGYVKIVEEAIKKIDGPMISKPEYDDFMAKFEVAQHARSRKDLRKAIDRLAELSRHERPRLAAVAEEPLREINDEGMAHVAEAERIAWENPAQAKESLKRVISKYAPLECSKKAEELLKRIMEKGR